MKDYFGGGLCVNGYNFEKSKEGEKLKDNWFRTWKPLIADYMTKKKLMIVVDNKPGHYDWDKVASENVKIVFTLCPIKKKELEKEHLVMIIINTVSDIFREKRKDSIMRANVRMKFHRKHLINFVR